MRKSFMQNRPLRLLFLVYWISGFGGCTVFEPTKVHDQATLGKGIVLGTQGYREIQQDLAKPDSDARNLEGQVIKIEGAAYLIKESTDRVSRIPIDQNTSIDRPAHIGDWIEVYLDDRGRAILIRNIDDHIQDGSNG